MFCSKCGSNIEEGAKFCQKCGAPVKGVIKASNNSAVIVVLVLQILQLILYFVPVFNFSARGYGEEKGKIAEVCSDVAEGLYNDVPGFNPTGAIVILSVVAIISTVLLLLKIYQGAIIGHIIRFVSCIFTSIIYLYAWLLLFNFCSEFSQYKDFFGTEFGLKMTFGGVLLHVVDIALFVAIIVVIPHVNKLKEMQFNSIVIEEKAS